MNQKKNYKEDFFPSGYDNNQPIYFSMVYQKIFKKKTIFQMDKSTINQFIWNGNRMNIDGKKM